MKPESLTSISQTAHFPPAFGCVDGLLTLLDRFGTMPRESYCTRNRLARDGFLVDFLSRHIRKYVKSFKF